MTDDQLLRYSRHILLDDIGIDGQQRLLDAHALVIGAGGLGSPVLLYLASAGVGRITVLDHDHVDMTNLQRQIAHTQARVGTAKVESAREAMLAVNPGIEVEARAERATPQLLHAVVQGKTVVVDCTDNFATRHAINAACVAHRVPLVSGAAIRFDGQVAVYDSRAANGPCYACAFPEGIGADEVHCATMGVFAPLVGIIGSAQAALAVQLAAGMGDALAGRLQMLDARHMEWSEVRLSRDPTCAVCGAR